MARDLTSDSPEPYLGHREDLLSDGFDDWFWLDLIDVIRVHRILAVIVFLVHVLFVRMRGVFSASGQMPPF
jgi:hypothetical protein